MCGRFAMTGDIDFYRGYYGVDEVVTEPLDQSWNVAPTDQTYVIADHDHKRKLGKMAWGLVPAWSKTPKSVQINARIETVATKPAFKRALSRHRCLIPADGFYEWEPPHRGRTPHWIHRADGRPLTFAGIWSAWKDPGTGEWSRGFAIITTEAQGVIRRVHDRMPVALADEAWAAWLDPGVTDPQAALALVRTVDPEVLMEHPVSSRVNSVKNNDPALIATSA